MYRSWANESDVPKRICRSADLVGDLLLPLHHNDRSPRATREIADDAAMWQVGERLGPVPSVPPERLRGQGADLAQTAQDVALDQYGHVVAYPRSVEGLQFLGEEREAMRTGTMTDTLPPTRCRSARAAMLFEAAAVTVSTPGLSLMRSPTVPNNRLVHDRSG